MNTRTIKPKDAFGQQTKVSGANSHHREYDEYIDDVERCEDFYEGRRAWISKINFDPTKLIEYLPKAPAEDGEEYFDRARRSLFHNFFKPSIDMFVALISKFDLTEEREYKNNIDLQGSDIASFKTDADTLALRDGFAVIVVSYGIDRPYLNLIEREDLINWDFVYTASGEKKMALAVIKREETERTSKFESEEFDTRWVYFLNDEGFVELEKYYEKDNNWLLEDVPIILKDVNQNPLTELPITIYSVSDRNAICEPPPLLDLLEKVKTHYQVYSDYQRTIYKLQPTYIRTWADFIPDNPPAMTIGSSLAIEAANGCTVDVLQINPSAVAPMREMLMDLRIEIKAEAMSFLGQSSVQQTDDEIAMKMAQGKASLRKFALRQKSLWQQIFSYWDKWLGLEEGEATIEVDINVLDKPVTPQEVQLILDGVSSGTLDASTATAKLHQLRWLPDGFELTSIAQPQLVNL